MTSVKIFSTDLHFLNKRIFWALCSAVNLILIEEKGDSDLLWCVRRLLDVFMILSHGTKDFQEAMTMVADWAELVSRLFKINRTYIPPHKWNYQSISPWRGVCLYFFIFRSFDWQAALNTNEGDLGRTQDYNSVCSKATNGTNRG